MKKIMLSIILSMSIHCILCATTSYPVNKFKDMKVNSINNHITYYSFEEDRKTGPFDAEWTIWEYSIWTSSQTSRYICGVSTAPYNSAWNNRENNTYYEPGQYRQHPYTSTV